MPTVYLETTIISYLAARPSRDLLVAARQQITHDWWDNSAARFDLCVSQLVRNEAGRGDPAAVARRMEYLRRSRILEEPESAVELALDLVAGGAVPRSAASDAAHIAIAAACAMDYLLTWNCAHINNAERIGAIESVCRKSGFACPRICSPEELP
jgi:hypothetical protein